MTRLSDNLFICLYKCNSEQNSLILFLGVNYKALHYKLIEGQNLLTNQTLASIALVLHDIEAKYL